MKKALLLCVALSVLAIVSTAHAATFSFVPPSRDVRDLDHAYYYAWNINAPGLVGLDLSSAQLVFTGIYDYTVEDGDYLYATLMDSPRTSGALIGTNSYSSLYRFTDNGIGGNNWAGQGADIGTWSDPYGNYAHRIDLVMDFDQNALDSLEQYLANGGNFTVGLDPDCHYYNNGVKLVVNTPVPEPASIMLLGMGVLGVFGLRRKA